MRRVTKGYSGEETPLFATILVNDQTSQVADETAFTGVDVVHGEAVTTISSIDAGQGSGNITKSPTKPYVSPFLGGHTPGSDEGSMTLHELMVLCTQLSNKVKKLEQTVKTSQVTRRTKIIASDDEEDLVAEDPSKQGRIQGRYGQNLDTQEGFGAGLEVTNTNAELNTASTFVSTASPQRHANTTADDLTLAETLMEIRKSVAKAKGKAKMDETEVATDEDFVQQLQAGEKCSEEDLPMKLVELVNQRKKFFAQQRAKAKRNKPITPAQQKEYMSNYIKNQEGGYSFKQLKSLSFEQVKEIFETTMRKVQSFVPMRSELEVQRLKRADQEVLEEPIKRQNIGEASGSGEESAEKEKELSKEELHKLLVIVPVEEVYVEALQIFAEMLKKFNRDDLVKLWDLVKEIFSTTEPTDDKEKKLWVKLKRLFEPDSDDTLWKL
ncbi:hypothetical protein Tco_1228494 [Tanacetum coccineum]